MATESDNWRLQFLSDNSVPVCPEAWAALEEANSNPDDAYAISYGNDRFTAEATRLIQELFETECEVFFVFNGTGANSLSLASICQSYHGILCHALAHPATTEANAPEFYTGGAKFLQVEGADGKIDPLALQVRLQRDHDIHLAKIKAVTVTQATEIGTVYTPQELGRLAALKDEYPQFDLKFHMDGARFANAMAALDGVTPKELTWQAGIDVLAFGGTKNGFSGTEAIVIFDKALGRDFAWRRKQAGQLASKMRYLAAPWIGMLKTGAWLTHARHANDHARMLARELTSFPEISLNHETQASAVFVHLPKAVSDGLRARGWRFHHYPKIDAWRFLCNWKSSKEGIAALIDDVRDLLGTANDHR